MVYYETEGMVEFEDIKKENDIAVILHLYYESLLDDIYDRLKNIPDFDIYISIPIEKKDLIDKVFSIFPKSKILIVQNRGRDIYPFLEIYKSIERLCYFYILKLHTKKSQHREDGDLWRNEIFTKLIGSRSSVSRIIKEFEMDEKLGIIGPKGHVIDYKIYWGANKENVKRLAEQCEVPFSGEESFNFVAGTMFWARPAALAKLLYLRFEAVDFPAEPIEPDGTLAHAIERFIGLVATKDGYQIMQSDDVGNISLPDGCMAEKRYRYGFPNENINELTNAISGNNKPNKRVAIIQKMGKVLGRLKKRLKKTGLY